MYSFLPRIICIVALIVNFMIISYVIYDEHKKNKVRQEEVSKENVEEFILDVKEHTIDTDKLEPIIDLSKEQAKEQEEKSESTELISLGEFKLTSYCPCNICCGEWANNRPNGIVYGSIGEELKEGYSIAVDPEVIPYRSKVVINGHTYKAQDRGGAIKGNRIDIYMEDHQKALEFGIQYAEVFVKK